MLKSLFHSYICECLIVHVALGHVQFLFFLLISSVPITVLNYLTKCLLINHFVLNSWKAMISKKNSDFAFGVYTVVRKVDK